MLEAEVELRHQKDMNLYKVYMGVAIAGMQLVTFSRMAISTNIKQSILVVGNIQQL